MIPRSPALGSTLERASGCALLCLALAACPSAGPDQGLDAEAAAGSDASAPAIDAALAPGVDAALGLADAAQERPDAGAPDAEAPDAAAPICHDGPDGGWQTYAADDTRMRLMGRFNLTNPKRPKASASGAALKARFHGQSVAVMLQDEFLWGQRGFYDVVIDGHPPVKIEPVQGSTSYPVPLALECGDHDLTLIKRTEASMGTVEYLGLQAAGLLPLSAAPTRRIEVIGDSITCGSGAEAVDGSAECSQDSWYQPGGWAQPYESATLAWGSFLADMLGAERHTTCASGIGLVRNYSSQYDARPMPQVYDLLFIEQTTSAAWPTSGYAPDVIVIGLGTNDFSPGDSARPTMDVATFSNAYVAFIDTLKGYYPGVHIVLSSSPMLGDHWPTSTDMSATSLKDAIDAVVAHYQSATDVHVDEVFVTKIAGTGCGTHPSADQQAALAGEIAPVVRAVMGWQ